MFAVRAHLEANVTRSATRAWFSDHALPGKSSATQRCARRATARWFPGRDPMGEFAAVLQRRLEDEYASLAAARSADDQDLTEALLAEIENLHRIAAEHGVRLPRKRKPGA